MKRREFLAAAVAAVLPGASGIASAGSGPALTLMHVHGLSYSADGKQLMLPSHDGLAVYSGGRWSKAAGPGHDYMGFSATRQAIYSSGHPAPGSGLTNPFGLIRSADGGKTWQKLGLEGESDFHLLATSYGTDAVYVLNHQKNSRMPGAGIYHTTDNGGHWQSAEARGLPAKINALAVHPANASMVAAATDDGIYLSRDAAASFEPLVSGRQVLSAFFDLEGKRLWFGTFASRPGLAVVALHAAAKAQEMTLPFRGEDAVSYIAQNPVRREEFAIATFRRSVFVSRDSGRAWTSIAKEGVTGD